MAAESEKIVKTYEEFLRLLMHEIILGFKYPQQSYLVVPIIETSTQFKEIMKIRKKYKYPYTNEKGEDIIPNKEISEMLNRINTIV